MFCVVGVREMKVAGWEEDCCEGVQEERRTGPGLSLLLSGQGPGLAQEGYVCRLHKLAIASCGWCKEYVRTNVPAAD